MKRLRKVPIFILVLLLGIFLSGCNNQTEPPNNSDQSDSAQTMEIAVYYLKSTDKEIYLVREVHQVEKTTEVAQAALNELIKGDPVTPDAARVLPEDTRILGINIDNGLATVDFSPEVLRANVGSSSEGLGIASIVNTLTEYPTIQEVAFTVDGQVENAMDWWGHVGLYEQPFQRDLSNVFEPPIWVTSPVKDQVIASPVKISGNARVFEATVSFRLRDTAGNVLAEGFTTAAEGAPGRGDFEGELAFKPDGSGQGQLEVFEVSMKDGSDRNKVIIPVEW